MPTQTPSLNIKGRDAGWEGTEIQLYTCSECGCQASGAGQHSGWHDNITNTINQLNDAINQVAQSVQQEAQTRQQVDNNLQAQINTKT